MTFFKKNRKSSQKKTQCKEKKAILHLKILSSTEAEPSLHCSTLHNRMHEFYNLSTCVPNCQPYHSFHSKDKHIIRASHLNSFHIAFTQSIIQIIFCNISCIPFIAVSSLKLSLVYCIVMHLYVLSDS